MASKRKTDSEQHDPKRICVSAVEANLRAGATQVEKHMFVYEVVKNEFCTQEVLVGWASDWFDFVTASPSRVVQGTILWYGFRGLDSLLLGANRIGKQAIVQEIVKVASQEAKKLPPVYPEEHEEVYSKLAMLPNFPPVGREFPNVECLCSLCVMMPSILTTRTGMLFFQEVVGKVDQLYAFGNTLSTMKDINHPSCLHCTYATDAMSDTTRFVVLTSGNTKVVVALQPGQQVVASQKFDDKIHKMVASIDGPFDEGRSKSPKLQASFDGKHLLWVHNKADPDVACFTVINTTTSQVTCLHAYYSSTSAVWWAGQDLLGLRVGPEDAFDAWQSARLSEVQQVPQKLARTYRGTRGCIANNSAVGVQQYGKKVLLTRLGLGVTNMWSFETLKSSLSAEEEYTFLNDALDVVPHPQDSGVFVTVYTSKNVPIIFYTDCSSNTKVVTKCHMMKHLFRQVWPSPKGISELCESFDV